jgi:hypothetical protein
VSCQAVKGRGGQISCAADMITFPLASNRSSQLGEEETAKSVPCVYGFQSCHLSSSLERTDKAPKIPVGQSCHRVRYKELQFGMPEREGTTAWAMLLGIVPPRLAGR